MLEIDATVMLNKIRKQNLLDSKGKELGKKSGRKRMDENRMNILQIMKDNPKVSLHKLIGTLVLVTI